MAFLVNLFRPIPVRPLDELGMSGDAKEAVAFALLADATIQGMAANVPQATGAKRPAILGKIIL
jgi:anhydro-N-acetylmuramic acid kinase